MKGYLSHNKIEFVLFHLGMNISLSDDMKDRFVFERDNNVATVSEKIIFPLSENSFDINNVIYRQNLPVLFPITPGDDFYHIEKGNLIFHDDLFKGVFYLLSGYQEINPESLDHWGRFPYDLSVQKELKICCKPLVNYYFEKIHEGIIEFLRLSGKSAKKTSYFNNFCFFLSHDVDRIDTYTRSEVGYKIKQALGLARSPFNRIRTIGIAMNYLKNYLNFINRKNPQWDFQYHIETEKKFGFRSTFYFLPRGLIHQDAYYSFNEKRINNLFRTLREVECEIGLHGTVRSAFDEKVLIENYNELMHHLGKAPMGIRQHRLLFDINKTPLLHHNAGIMYDTSLGFAEHEGFRNSYCLPFRLYDHKNDMMLDVWEIPLVAMDATLFHYRSHDPVSARDSLNGILQEVRRFNGVFSLLWHNGYFDEILYPGIRKFYENQLRDISNCGAESLTGREIIERLKYKS